MQWSGIQDRGETIKLMPMLIVKEETLARDRLRRMIEIDGQQKVLADVASGQDAIRQCNKLRPEICLLDIRMPGLVGIETVQHFLTLEEPLAIIFYCL